MKKHKRDIHLSKKNKTSKAVEKLIWKKFSFIDNGRVHCNDCNQTLSCFKSARSHYKKFHMAKNDGSKFICNLCNEEFAMKYDLMNHLKEIHSRTKTPKGIIYDKLKHIGNGRIECLECNKIFSSKETARVHHKYVHMKDYIAFKCEVCLKHFKHKVSLVSHMQNMHTADKNGNKFLCKVCSEEF